MCCYLNHSYLIIITYQGIKLVEFINFIRKFYKPFGKNLVNLKYLQLNLHFLHIKTSETFTFDLRWSWYTMRNTKKCDIYNSSDLQESNINSEVWALIDYRFYKRIWQGAAKVFIWTFRKNKPNWKWCQNNSKFILEAKRLHTDRKWIE